ncbi:unnamed protein product [Amoebophrya sp. A120]|nr:unnamed protein product [Amoebophrya sp. A120]|eukprot:GSA120T00021322001.1
MLTAAEIRSLAQEVKALDPDLGAFEYQPAPAQDAHAVGTSSHVFAQPHHTVAQHERSSSSSSARPDYEYRYQEPSRGHASEFDVSIKPPTRPSARPKNKKANLTLTAYDDTPGGPTAKFLRGLRSTGDPPLISGNSKSSPSSANNVADRNAQSRSGLVSRHSGPAFTSSGSKSARASSVNFVYKNSKTSSFDYFTKANSYSSLTSTPRARGTERTSFPLDDANDSSTLSAGMTCPDGRQLLVVDHSMEQTSKNIEDLRREASRDIFVPLNRRPGYHRRGSSKTGGVDPHRTTTTSKASSSRLNSKASVGTALAASGTTSKSSAVRGRLPETDQNSLKQYVVPVATESQVRKRHWKMQKQKTGLLQNAMRDLQHIQEVLERPKQLPKFDGNGVEQRPQTIFQPPKRTAAFHLSTRNSANPRSASLGGTPTVIGFHPSSSSSGVALKNNPGFLSACSNKKSDTSAAIVVGYDARGHRVIQMRDSLLDSSHNVSTTYEDYDEEYSASASATANQEGTAGAPVGATSSGTHVVQQAVSHRPFQFYNEEENVATDAEVEVVAETRKEKSLAELKAELEADLLGKAPAERDRIIQKATTQGLSSLDSIVQEIRARGTAATTCSENSICISTTTAKSSKSHYRKFLPLSPNESTFTPRLNLTRRKTKELLGSSRANFANVAERLTYMGRSYQKRHQSLVQKHKTSRENAFLRLANSKKTLPASDRLVQNVGNIGYRTTRQQERRQLSIERKREELERKQMKDCTFQPKVFLYGQTSRSRSEGGHNGSSKGSTTSRCSYWRGKHQNQIDSFADQNFYTRLKTSQVRREEKLRNVSSMRESMEIEDCSFKPELSSGTKKLKCESKIKEFWTAGQGLDLATTTGAASTSGAISSSAVPLFTPGASLKYNAGLLTSATSRAASVPAGRGSSGSKTEDFGTMSLAEQQLRMLDSSSKRTASSKTSSAAPGMVDADVFYAQETPAGDGAQPGAVLGTKPRIILRRKARSGRAMDAIPFVDESPCGDPDLAYVLEQHLSA